MYLKPLKLSLNVTFVLYNHEEVPNKTLVKDVR